MPVARKTIDRDSKIDFVGIFPSMKTEKGFMVAAELGTVAGLRSMSALATVSYAARSRGVEVMGDRWIKAATILAIGEVVADKLPITPSRIKPTPLSGRMLSGAIAGAVAHQMMGDAPKRGAAIGAAAAAIASFAGYAARRYLTHRKGWPDFIVALAEDAFTVGVSIYALGGLLQKDASTNQEAAA